MTTFRGVSNAAGQASGSAGASTVSITPTLPGSAASGDRIYVFACGTTTSGTTPTSWTVVGTKDTTIGSGAVASGSGARRGTWYYRDYDGVWTMPAWTLTSTTNNSHWVGAVALTPTATYTFDTPTISTVGGSFNTATTSYTDTSAASVTTHTNGYLLAGSCFNDNVTSSACAITQTGATFGAVTERCDGGTGTGNVVAGKIHTCPVTTGASATITQTQTISAASQGETLFVEQTETAPSPAISTLTDDFNTGTVPDAGKWSNAGAWTLDSGGLFITGSNVSGQMLSAVTYNFTGDALYAQLKSFTSSGNAGPPMYIGFGDASSLAFHGWAFQGSTASAYANDVTTGSTRTHTNNDWYRVRESGGSVFMDYSADGTNWTNLTSVTTPAGIAARYVVIYFDTTAGTGIGGAGTARIDNFNTAPAVTNTGAFFAMF